MKKKELLFFEWVIIDNCNLNCNYCVNKGEYSQKDRSKMNYIPGIEIEVAEKIVDISKLFEKVIVNLTGGEPLLANNIADVILILSSACNIEIKLITNFRLITKISNCVQNLSSLLVSLHIKQRTNNEILHLIELINQFKNKTSMTLSQVDHDLTIEDRKKLAQISLKTGKDIQFQTFIPPWTEDGKIEKGQEVSDTTFVKSLGKRCCLGYTHFFLNPDGSFYYGLWCNEKTRKKGNFLLRLSSIQDAFFPDHMSKCPASSCGCNYNLFHYEVYRSICKKLGYKEEEIFGARNTKVIELLNIRLSFLINKYLKFVKKFKHYSVRDLIKNLVKGKLIENSK